MTRQISPPLKRILALSLLGAVLGLTWLGLIQPVRSYLSNGSEQRSSALRTLARNRALVQEEPALQAALAAVDQSTRWRNFYDGPKVESAMLQLETDLRAILRDSNNPTTMTAEPALPRGSVTRIAVRVTLSMRADELANALDRLHKHTRQLQIEKLNIQSPDVQTTQANPILIVQAQIAGWMTSPPGRKS